MTINKSDGNLQLNRRNKPKNQPQATKGAQDMPMIKSFIACNHFSFRASPKRWPDTTYLHMGYISELHVLA